MFRLKTALVFALVATLVLFSSLLTSACFQQRTTQVFIYSEIE